MFLYLKICISRYLVNKFEFFVKLYVYVYINLNCKILRIFFFYEVISVKEL